MGIKGNEKNDMMVGRNQIILHELVELPKITNATSIPLWSQLLKAMSHLIDSVKQTCYFTLTSENQIVDGQADFNGAKTASLSDVETFCTTVWAEYTLSQKCKTDFKSENFRPITYGCPARQIDHLLVAHLLMSLARERDRKRMVLLFFFHNNK